jgi:hypothetical protein
LDNRANSVLITRSTICIMLGQHCCHQEHARLNKRQNTMQEEEWRQPAQLELICRHTQVALARAQPHGIMQLWLLYVNCTNCTQTNCTQCKHTAVHQAEHVCVLRAACLVGCLYGTRFTRLHVV